VIDKLGAITDELISVANAYLDAITNDKEDMTVEGIIASNLQPFPKASFEVSDYASPCLKSVKKAYELAFLKF
jgi:hypothetical protein